MTVINAAKATDCKIKLDHCQKNVDSDKVRISRLFLDYCVKASNANCKVQIDLSEYRESFSGTLSATSPGGEQPKENNNSQP